VQSSFNFEEKVGKKAIIIVFFNASSFHHQKLPSMKLPPGGLPANPPLPPLQSARPEEPLQNPLSNAFFTPPPPA
jgi:hypothetical protein